jgi:hypothetical protein
VKKIQMQRIGKTAWLDSWDRLKIQAGFGPSYTDCESVVDFLGNQLSNRETQEVCYYLTLNHLDYLIPSLQLLSTAPLYFRHIKAVLRLS